MTIKKEKQQIRREIERLERQFRGKKDRRGGARKGAGRPRKIPLTEEEAEARAALKRHGGARPNSGRPKHEPTAAQRKIVKTLAGYGMPYDQIASHVEVAVGCLTRHYRRELIEGPMLANASVVAGLYKNATEGGRVDAQKHWTQHRCGWTDKKSLEISGPDGAPIRHSWSDSEIEGMSEEELSTLYAEAATKAGTSVH